MSDQAPYSGRMALNQIQMLPKNPKDHDLGSIHHSLDTFKVMLVPITINRTTGHLIAGHGRVEALIQRRDLGKEPDLGIEVHDGDWWVPVWFVYLPDDPDIELAAAIALNKTTEMGGWHAESLADILVAIGHRDESLLLATGFDHQEVSNLLFLTKRTTMSDLLKKHGDPQEDDFWPVIHLKVPPALHERFRALMENCQGSTDAERFEYLLDSVVLEEIA